MDTIYSNAYNCEVTLNKKHKDLFLGYGIRLGTQEIARYDWNDEALDKTALILSQLSEKDANVSFIKKVIQELPEKKIHYAYTMEEIERFQSLMVK